MLERSNGTVRDIGWDDEFLFFFFKDELTVRMNRFYNECLRFHFVFFSCIICFCFVPLYLWYLIIIFGSADAINIFEKNSNLHQMKGTHFTFVPFQEESKIYFPFYQHHHPFPHLLWIQSKKKRRRKLRWKIQSNRKKWNKRMPM